METLLTTLSIVAGAVAFLAIAALVDHVLNRLGGD